MSLYVFVAALGLSLGLTHERHRPWTLVSLCVFFIFGWLYVILHFATHTVAFIKVFTGSTGKWEVTMRSIKGVSPQSLQNLSLLSQPDGARQESGSPWYKSILRWKVPGFSAPLAEPLLTAAERDQQERSGT